MLPTNLDMIVAKGHSLIIKNKLKDNFYGNYGEITKISPRVLVGN